MKDPNAFLFDHLLTFKPVKFLEGELIHDLLTIFVSAKLASYVKFYQNNKDFIDSLGKFWGLFFGGVERRWECAILCYAIQQMWPWPNV